MSDLEDKSNIYAVNIEEEMKKSYIDYAMSVIIGRALPDVRDGLKPVHRRILYAMYEKGMTSDKPYKKSARIVGDVLGQYHPHGDSSVYDALVRMAQDFSIRYPFVDGHGNFGSIDGDSAAAMRYTEVRLEKISMEMMEDINKDTVDFIPNYDESQQEPSVLPARIPSLLVNGSSGIAVGMATNIPPHNLGEVVDGVNALMDNPDLDIYELMAYIKGPDFPTAAHIMGRQGIVKAYTTGRGTVRVRGKAHIEEMSGGKHQIIISEIPYQVNKSNLIENIANLVREKKLDGITDLRDESDREGIRVVIELRKDAMPQIVLNHLYKHTQLQDSFGINLLALVDGEPKTLNLKEILEHYIQHQKNVIVRRTRFDLKKAEERKEIVEGLQIALDNIDEVIRIIRGSRDIQIAKTTLMENFFLSDRQAQHILEMQLRRLTGLEREKIAAELEELKRTIAHLNEVLGDEALVIAIIRDDLLRIKEKYADERRTTILRDTQELDVEDLIADEEMVITITHSGYIKRLNPNVYRSQRRGGKGITAMTTRTEDFLENLFIASTHDYLMIFTDAGRVYRIKVHEIPESSRTSKGTAIVNLINISGEDKVTTLFPVRSFDEDRYLLMSTVKGQIKKTPLKEYDSHRRDGIIGISLNEGDKLLGVRLIKANDQILLSSMTGLSVRFGEEEVRTVSRASKGVRGMRLGIRDALVSMAVIDPEDTEGKYLLVVSENGFGKRTKLDEYSLVHRGGKGILTMKVTEKTGLVSNIRVVEGDQQIMLISREGIIIRTRIAEIPVIGRNTQGVTIMRLDKDDMVMSVATVINEENGDIEE